MSQSNPTAFEAGADVAVKKIPILGQVYAATEGISNILTKAFPGVFDTNEGISSKVAANFDQTIYNKYKDSLYFAMMFDDAKFVNPTTIFGGVHPMLILSKDQYDQNVSNGYFENGITIKPLQGKYLLFPNIVKAYVIDQVNQANAVQQQQQQITDDKSKYGPLYPLVNWFRTSPTVQNTVNEFKAGTTQIGQDIKTATGGSLTSSPWLIGSMVVVGGLAIVYVILED
jgi:hypothetical protein